MKMMGETSKRRSNGGAMRGASRRSPPHARGSRIAVSASSWVNPIVTTVRIKRGARKKRRMTASSTSAPSTTEAASPAARARK